MTALHGFQLRLARHACDLTTRDVRARLGVSLTTLTRIEGHRGPLPIGTGYRQADTFEPATVAALVALYEGLGVSFIEGHGPHPPGVRFDESRIIASSSSAVTTPRRSARQAARKAARSAKVKR
jgi:hypothetical protein